MTLIVFCVLPARRWWAESATRRQSDDVIANRIIVDHVYHRVDYQLLWNTLKRDVPALGAALEAWARERGIVLDQGRLPHQRLDSPERGVER